MGKKKRDHNVVTFFCYYCDKEYDFKDTLLEHQRDRHFSCLKCPKKFSTAGSMATHMNSVHRETLARVPNAKIGRDNLDISIYGMENVPTAVIQEKMIQKLKKKRQILQDEIQKKMNLNQKLHPKNIQEMKESNDFFDLYKKYTLNMETAAGIRYMMNQPQHDQMAQQYYQEPPPEEEKHKLEDKRESKWQQKVEEEKSAINFIMKDEMKRPEEPIQVKPSLNINGRVLGVIL